MPRFVVLYHETPPSADRSPHWDLMLETGGGLQTWALPAAPTPGDTIRAEPLPDHRLKYLDYEGELSGDRGRVSRWDAGTYELMQKSEAAMVVHLDGDRLRGKLKITQTAAVHISFCPTVKP
ncbi:MAG: DNA polymerase ligase N-terminal domain-containing protein [Pirellulales bacterium]